MAMHQNLEPDISYKLTSFEKEYYKLKETQDSLEDETLTVEVKLTRVEQLLTERDEVGERYSFLENKLEGNSQAKARYDELDNAMSIMLYELKLFRINQLCEQLKLNKLSQFEPMISDEKYMNNEDLFNKVKENIELINVEKIRSKIEQDMRLLKMVGTSKDINEITEKIESSMNKANNLIETMKGYLNKKELEKMKQESEKKKQELERIKPKYKEIYLQQKADTLLRTKKKLDLYAKQLSSKSFDQIKKQALEEITSFYNAYLNINEKAATLEEAHNNNDLFNVNIDAFNYSLFGDMRKSFKEMHEEIKSPDKNVKDDSQSITDESFPELKAVESTHKIEGGLIAAENPVKIFLKDGAMFHADQKEHFDTKEGFSHLKTGYMSYVLKKDGLYLFNHFDGYDRISHATYGMGGILSAGEMQIVDGKLQTLTAYSGHYKPDELYVFNTLAYLKKFKFDFQDTDIKLKFPIDKEYKLNPKTAPIASSASYSPRETNTSMVTYRADDLYTRVEPDMPLFERLKKIENNIIDPKIKGKSLYDEMINIKKDILKKNKNDEFIIPVINKKMDALEQKVIHDRCQFLQGIISDPDNKGKDILNELKEIKKEYNIEKPEFFMVINKKLDDLYVKINESNMKFDFDNKKDYLQHYLTEIKTKIPDPENNGKHLSDEIADIEKGLSSANLNNEEIASYEKRLREIHDQVAQINKSRGTVVYSPSLQAAASPYAGKKADNDKDNESKKNEEPVESYRMRPP